MGQSSELNNQYHALRLNLPLFWFTLFDTLKSLIHFFFNSSTLHMLFSLAIHPQQPLQDWNIQYKLVGLPTKCSIELLVWIRKRKFASPTSNHAKILMVTEFEVQYAFSGSDTVLDRSLIDQSNCEFATSHNTIKARERPVTMALTIPPKEAVPLDWNFLQWSFAVLALLCYTGCPQKLLQSGQRYIVVSSLSLFFPGVWQNW